MRPYNWINKYPRVYEIKGNSTCWSKKSKRQENKKIIQQGLYEHVYNMSYFEDDVYDYLDEEYRIK